MKDLHDLAQLDLNLLVAFDALAETGSVTAAAQRTGVSQSAMSHTLRRLRVALDDPLMVRAGASMVLTPRAQAMQVPIRAALQALSRAVSAQPDFDPATERRLFAVASPDLFDWLVAPALIAALGREAPTIALSLRPMVGERLPLQLQSGEIDLAIVPIASWAAVPDRADLVQRVLARDSYRCYLRADHPALRGGALSAEDYLALGHLVVSPRGSGPGLIDTVLATHDRERTIGARVPSFALAPRIVAVTDLVLTAPTTLQRALGDLPVRSVPCPYPIPDHAIGMLWHERFAVDPAHRWFRDRLADLTTSILEDAAASCDW